MADTLVIPTAELTGGGRGCSKPQGVLTAMIPASLSLPGSLTLHRLTPHVLVPYSLENH